MVQKLYFDIFQKRGLWKYLAGEIILANETGIEDIFSFHKNNIQYTKMNQNRQRVRPLLELEKGSWRRKGGHEYNGRVANYNKYLLESRTN